MVEFVTVSREIRSLVGRRRELQTLLGSLFAGLGIFLQNSLQGGLPEALISIRRHIFAFYAFLLMVPSLILALRMATLQGGMVRNGILFARLTGGHEAFLEPWSVARARKHNFFGVSFLQFVMMDLVAGFSTTIFLMAVHVRRAVALPAGGSVVLAWMVIYFWLHRRSARIALGQVAAEEFGRFDKDDWEAHISGSLEDANVGLNSEVAFVGLIVFSVFETVSGLGKMKSAGLDLAPDLILQYGPIASVILMTITCFLGLVNYLRLRLAIGRFSLILDPRDRPYRPLPVTDSMLGYLIVAFLFTMSTHLLFNLTSPRLNPEDWGLLATDAIVFLGCYAAEKITLTVAHLSSEKAKARKKAEFEKAEADRAAALEAWKAEVVEAWKAESARSPD